MEGSLIQIKYTCAEVVLQPPQYTKTTHKNKEKNEQQTEVYLKTYGIKLEIPFWKRFFLGFPILNLFMNRVKVRVDATVFTAKGEPLCGTFRIFNTYYTINSKKNCVHVHLPLLIAQTVHGFGTHICVEFLNRRFLKIIGRDAEVYSKSLGYIVDRSVPITAHIWEKIDASIGISIPIKEGAK